jgi:hypothetical protein
LDPEPRELGVSGGGAPFCPSAELLQATSNATTAPSVADLAGGIEDHGRASTERACQKHRIELRLATTERRRKELSRS